MQEAGQTFVVIGFVDLSVMQGEQGAKVPVEAVVAAEAAVSEAERVATEVIVTEAVATESFSTAVEVAVSLVETVTVSMIKTLAFADS